MKPLLLISLSWLCLAAFVQAADPEEAQYNVVVTLYNAGQWQAAIKKIEEREKVTLPDVMRAKYLAAKGLAYEKGEKSAEARAAYEQLLAKFPQAPESKAARLAMIHLDYAAGNFDAVIQGHAAIDQASLAAADKKDLALMLAESLYTKDDPKAARAAYESAIRLGADKNAVAGRLFDLYARLQAHKELVEISATAIPGLDAHLVALARAEAMMALGQTEPAIVEAAKIPVGNQYHPRAAFLRGLALVKLGKLKEAVEPLTAAVQTLKDPPAPPAAFITLAECLMESGKAKEAEPYLAKAEKLAATLPDAEKAALLKQLTFVKLRQTLGAGNRKEMIQMIAKSRDTVPKDQLPRLLYMRLYALSEEGDDNAIVATMKDDLPVFQSAAEDGSATLIYFAALRKVKRQEEALTLLDEFVKRKPSAPEAIRARLELANVALEKQEFDKAAAHLDAIRGAPGAEGQLGKETFHKVLFNRAVAAEKLSKPDEAIAVLTQLIAVAPTAPSYVLLGQMYAVKNDFKNATETWKKALALGDSADLRDRLGRVAFAAKDFPGACEHFEAEARLLGGLDKLSRESAEAFARARFSAGQFAAAATLYEELHRRFRDTPAFAYECAVAHEREKKMAEAAKWYEIAQKAKARLPAEYAKSVDANLAQARMQSGSDDMGASYWIESLSAQTADAAFESALVPIRKLAVAGKLGGATRGKVESVLNGYGPSQPRYYALGAVLLEGLSAEKKSADLQKFAAKLTTEFAANESKLDPKSSGATLAPAIIYFYKGESDRLAGNHADALVSYETVLSAYPYNEWPDAAACGAAECYAALGDKPTALAKFNEVVKSSAGLAASAKWGELAKQRINELNKGD